MHHPLYEAVRLINVLAPCKCNDARKVAGGRAAFIPHPQSKVQSQSMDAVHIQEERLEGSRSGI